MKERIITGLVGGALFILVVLIGDWIFYLAISAMATIALNELFKMKNISPISIVGIISILMMWILLTPQAWFDQMVPVAYSKIEVIIFFILILLFLTVATKNSFHFSLVGFVLLSVAYVGFGFHYFIETRFIPDIGMALVFFILFLIWSTDSGAYFVGRTFGRKKLWPHISPNKTIEGSIGGIAVAFFIGTIFYLIYPVVPSYFKVVSIVIIVSITSQLGDLVQSALKRHYGVKDSGTILPGHGGILDRFDSLIYVMPILHLLKLLN